MDLFKKKNKKMKLNKERTKLQRKLVRQERELLLWGTESSILQELKL